MKLESNQVDGICHCPKIDKGTTHLGIHISCGGRMREEKNNGWD